MLWIPDYIDLFSLRRKGHMAKYVHMFRPCTYEEVLKQPTYYPFRMEKEILDKKLPEIASCIPKINHVFEVGPGSETAITSKTIPFMNSLITKHPLVSYRALDFSGEYAVGACEIIKRNFATLRTYPVEIDFLKPKSLRGIEDLNNFEGRKLLCGFGQPIFANNPEEDTLILLENLSSILSAEDYLFFSVDTTQDETTLEAAYNTSLTHALLLNVMHHLKSILSQPNSFDPEAFSMVYKWNKDTNNIDLSLKPTIEQHLNINGVDFILKESQLYTILQSRKPSIKYVEKLLHQCALQIVDIFTLENTRNNNNFCFLIAKKILIKK